MIPVADALARRGAIPVRFDTDLFPTQVGLSVRQEQSSTGATLHVPEGDVDLDDVSAVWYRRFAPGHALPAHMDMRSAAIRESRAVGAGLIEILPPDVEAALLALLDRFGLNYGAIDMILTPAGEYVFLEVNPAGEFLWLDDVGPLSISDAIAGVLIGVGRRI